MPGTTARTQLPQQRGSAFDADGLVAAMKAKDPGAWSSYYAPDAEWLEYRHHNPPRDPHRREGNLTIHEFLEGICADVEYLHVEDLVAGEDSIWFRRMVRLSDGRMLIEHVHLHVDAGLISREIDVESWDYA